MNAITPSPTPPLLEITIDSNEEAGLPLEMWSHIFSFLPPEDLLKTSKTCTWFQHLTFRIIVLKYINSLHLPFTRLGIETSSQVLEFFKSLGPLKESISYIGLENIVTVDPNHKVEIYKHIDNFRLQTPFHFSNLGIFSAAGILEFLRDLGDYKSSIQHLNITFKLNEGDESSNLQEEILVELSQCTNLRSLISKHLITKDEHFKYLARMVCLEVLVVQHGTEITGSGFIHLSQLKDLSTLDLYQCPELNAESLPDVSNDHTIRSLLLETCLKFNVSGLSKLASFHDLEVLHVNECVALTSEHLFTIAHFYNLRYIVLNDCNLVTDEGFSYLKNCIKLKSLSLHSKIIKGNFFNFLPLNLKELNVSCCKNITETNFKKLNRLKLLKILSIVGCDLIKKDLILAFKRLRPRCAIYTHVPWKTLM